jgi:hypothetical protein
MEDPSKAG